MFIIFVFLLGFKTLFSCVFTEFLLFSHKGSVEGCDSSLGSLFSSELNFTFLHFLSGYYYYDYVVIGVLRNSLLNRLTAI